MKLFAPAEYWAIPKKTRDSWGCGPGGIGDWLVPDTVYGLSVQPACSIHDGDYRVFGERTKQGRKAADKRFLINMQLIVNHHTKAFWLRRLRFTRCRTMYLAVRVLGKGAYFNDA